jgi:hypothetical protein
MWSAPNPQSVSGEVIAFEWVRVPGPDGRARIGCSKDEAEFAYYARYLSPGRAAKCLEHGDEPVHR